MISVPERLLLKVQKPGRYTGGELNSVHKDKQSIDARFAFCFPDSYEVGMSHLGMKILYSLLNEREDTWCERVFAPWTDMEEMMREHGIPLFALESQEPVKDFDFIGFTLQYELSYTTVLSMLDLAGIPLKSSERSGLGQIVIAGGPCTCNPEPVANFFDIIVPGEGEEVVCDIIDLYVSCKKAKKSREEFLIEASRIQGVYVPSLYDISYNADGTVEKTMSLKGAPGTVQKRFVRDLDKAYYPDKFVVPFIEIVHDRVMSEVLRGCIRGCRFCQAGFIYRPYREKSPDVINGQSKGLCESTGYDEISLSSLSSSDHRKLNELLDIMNEWTEEAKVSASLPSLRVDGFSDELLKKLNTVRKSGLTFAPEAGTQRMRDVINKNVTEESLLNTCRVAFDGGFTSIKLYFMLGLPTETDEDIVGIAELAQKVVDCFYASPNRQKGKSVTVTISTACYVPKPFTPFQWVAQDTPEELVRKQKLLKDSIRTGKIKYNYHDSATSLIEAVLARGDRRLCDVVLDVYKKGYRLESWSEFFSRDEWLDSLKAFGLTSGFYANRERSENEIFPWEHLDYGVDREFLRRQYECALDGQASPNCREKCLGCGINKLNGGACDV